MNDKEDAALRGHANERVIRELLSKGENQWPYNRREIPCAPHAIQAIETIKGMK